MRPVSRVTFLIDDENSVTAGDDTGFEIMASNPHATQAMANAVLARLKGYRYHAFAAGSANLDPAAELGDGITAGGVYGFIGRLNDDGSGYPGVDAPGEAELEDEYPSSEGPMTREINRKIAETRSSITKTAEQIRLEVTSDMQGLSASIDVKLGSITSRVDGLDGRYSSLTQTVDGITQRVQGLDGRFSVVEQTVDGLTITGPDGATYIRDSSIRTGSITADKLNIRGSISFADLEQDVVEEITSGITQAQAKTLIDSTLVSSPNIAGANFWNQEQTAKMQMKYNASSRMGYLALFSDGYSTQVEFLAIGLNPGTALGDAILINPFPYEMVTGKPFIEFHGNNFYGTTKNTGFLGGNWDFSEATITGLKTLSLSVADDDVSTYSSVVAKKEKGKVDLSTENGILKVEVDEVTWYLDATGWHQ